MLEGPDDLHRFAISLIRLIDTYQLADRSFIESSDPQFLRILKERSPSLKLFYYGDNFATCMSVADSLDLHGITIDMHKISRMQVDQAHAGGFKVTLFNQQTERDNIRSMELSPDHVQTDQLKHLLKVLDKYSR